MFGASARALCASMGPSMTSPMAKMLPDGAVVLKCSSTATRPRLSSSMPTFSRSRPSTNGRRPAEAKLGALVRREKAGMLESQTDADERILRNIHLLLALAPTEATGHT